MANARAQPDHRAWLITGALFLPLLLLAVVAVMTWRAERRYAAVTDRVIHDYAAIAAWQYARRASITLHEEVMKVFAPTANSPAHQRMGPTRHTASAEQLLNVGANSVFAPGVRFAFTYDVAADRLVVAGDAPGAVARERLKQRLVTVIRSSTSNDDPHRVVFDSIGGTSQAIALWAILNQDGGPRTIYGVGADPDALRTCFISLIGGAQLLPGLPANEKLTEDDIAVRLTRPDGTPVFSAQRPVGRTAATDSTGLQQGELWATVDLSPRVASLLLRGGAPPSQLPALALMITIAAVLAIVALRQQRHVRELQRVREQFVANVSHELRTPLAQISMFAETLALERERNPAERRQFASIIFAEARRLSALVESVLRFSRADSKRSLPVHDAHALVPEIETAVRAFRPIAEQADASVNLSSAGDWRVLLDRDGFRQIMLNLLENAVKHGGRGTTVDVSARMSAGEVHIAVDDNGPGVPLEWRERVFEPFERVDGRHVAGAGIGLAVVREIVVAHGGRVWIEPSPLGGARFMIALPVASPTPAGLPSDTSAATRA